MKPSNSEKRRWVINQKNLTVKRHKEGTCKTCHKKLSVYNLEKYCFLHRTASVYVQDEKDMDSFRTKANIYKKRSASERLDKNSETFEKK